MKKSTKITIGVVALAILLVIAGFAIFSLPKDTVTVSVENNTLTEAAGAKWTGNLFTVKVPVKGEVTAMEAIEAACKDAGIEIELDTAQGMIKSIDGLTESSDSDGETYDGWTATINDWFTDQSFANFTVTGGDEITVQYTVTWADLGGVWGDNNKTLKEITFSNGTLDKPFNSKKYAYVLETSDSEVKVTPVAANKNFLVKIFVNDVEYKRSTMIPVEDGTVITVVVGDPEWPSMNNGEFGSGAEDVPAVDYSFTVKIK